jgi:hypothetical protein
MTTRRAASAAEPSRGFTRGFSRARLANLVLLAVVACEHGEPFAVVPPDSVGPFTDALPRRLTFNPLADVTPSVIGDTVAFSRTDPNRADGDQCLALLPLEGGRLYRTLCAGRTASDTVRDTWTFPVVSPDRGRVAFVREREVLASGRLLTRELVIAPLQAPDSAAIVVAGVYHLPDGGLGNAFRDPAWSGDAAVRFLGGLETSGANASFEPRGVFEVIVGDDPSPDPQSIPELADAVAYAQREDGGVYFVSGSDPAGVYQWVPGAAPILATQFDCLDGSTFAGLTAVTAGAGGVAVLATCVYEGAGPRARLLWSDLDASGASRALDLPFVPERVAGVPGRRWLIVEAAGDLWLVGLP